MFPHIENDRLCNIQNVMGDNSNNERRWVVKLFEEQTGVATESGDSK